VASQGNRQRHQVDDWPPQLPLRGEQGLPPFWTLAATASGPEKSRVPHGGSRAAGARNGRCRRCGSSTEEGCEPRSAQRTACAAGAATTPSPKWNRVVSVTA